MNTLLRWQIYNSERFVVTGNIGFRIVITDKHEDKAYEIEYGELVKFRTHWDKLNKENKDMFLIALIHSKKGKAKTKEAA